MDWKLRIGTALRDAVDPDVIEELAQHAAAAYASARAEGCDAAEAERRVDLQIAAWTANPDLLKRRPKRAAVVAAPTGQAGALTSILQDARYAWRLLRKQPAYAALVVTTMALGIAATTVVGSVAYGVLLKPLPWADAPRLVRLFESRQGSTRRFRPMMTNITYGAWRDSISTLDMIGGWSQQEVTLSGTGTPERITIGEITPDLLTMLRATPAIGHAFAHNDDNPSRPRTVILSYGFWQQRFGGRSDALGQPLRLDDDVYTIVGVMPASFAFPDRRARAWVPLFIPPVMAPGQNGQRISLFQAIGRLRPGATAQQAAAEGTARGRTVPDPGPVTMAVFGSNGPVEITAVPLLESLTGEVRPALLILFAAVALLLVTATANVASLQLARATTRRREFAIRSAVGAERGRLVRQTLVENLLLGLLGGAAGLALAAVMQRALPAILPTGFPRLDDIAYDWRIQALAVALSAIAGLGCGLLPALSVAGTDLVPALVEDSLAPAGGGLRSRTSRVRAAIMAGQVGIACVLLVGALLLVRSFVALMHANVGYDRTSVLTSRLVFPEADPPAHRLVEMRELIARLRSGDGVKAVAYANSMPFSPREALSSFPLKKRSGDTIPVQTGSWNVSANYFTAMGQRVLEGRDFTPADLQTTQRVAIVNREFSRKYLDGQALGWTLPGSHTRPEALIVGVVEDTARHAVTDPPQPDVYWAAEQGGNGLADSDIFIAMRTDGDPTRAVPALRETTRAVAPMAPLDSITTMENMIGSSLAQPRLYAVLLATFAVFAVAIAGVGLFGVLSYSVAQRAREIGVRSALGAQVRDIVGLVVRQSIGIAGAGLVVGLTASAWMTTALRSFLYGVTPHDFVSFAVVAVVLLLMAVLASVVPARRAARVNPVNVLRS